MLFPVTSSLFFPKKIYLCTRIAETAGPDFPAKRQAGCFPARTFLFKIHILFAMHASSSSPASVEFSIVTVTFNCEDSIEKTMQSVFRQTYRSYEYLIIDGASTDRTPDLIRRHAGKLAAFVSEKDQGIYDAMNKGARLAHGKWILFLNSGDVLADESVLEKVAKITTTTTSDIVYGDMLLRKNGHLTIRTALEPANRHRMYFCHQSAFTRTAVMKAIPFDLRFKLAGDYCFFKQCYLSGYRFEHIPEPWAIYDVTGISTRNRLAVLTELIRIVKLWDKGTTKFVHLLRLYFVVGMLKLRGKSGRRKPS